ncbi:diaminopimelate epimerase [Corynebacterium anserum]|uniref:Diaminopimelate epimerase n=1 Tax=Corynebacterium anserum TaxID=2684406 RepID=A0A7G7YNQ1_9CORY|nr:diaminopimelate epimerase [Corynebacterium anserum]MBC2681708.1 diaminopimelate epimerase [Corynebacterium anserum]QNH96121.1 diaminopimelate epimerase [Corynebacterium anserum]
MTADNAHASTQTDSADNVEFIKAHGTENDFVVLLDPHVRIELTAQRVQNIADRRAGLGGDGVIRVATAQSLLDAGVLSTLPHDCVAEEWFMDYRNADGSLAEMCGNGVRVFAHVLVRNQLVDIQHNATFGIGTRGGRKKVTIHTFDDCHATVSVHMGQPDVLGLSTATVGDFTAAGLAVDMGNPHLACVIPGLTQEKLASLPIEQSVTWDEDFFPHGVNLEILTPRENGEIHMRVHERGVGETRSCGTGTVASAVAALATDGEEYGTVGVNVPGGRVDVTINQHGAMLTGPSAVVASGELYL